MGAEEGSPGKEYLAPQRLFFSSFLSSAQSSDCKKAKVSSELWEGAPGLTDPCQLLPALCNLWHQLCYSLFLDFTNGGPVLSFFCLILNSACLVWYLKGEQKGVIGPISRSSPFSSGF